MTEPFVRLLRGDCLERLAEVDDDSVDMILCDLPYGTTQNAWDVVVPLAPLWAHYERVCRGAIVLTASQPFTSALVSSRPDLFRYDWTWRKEPTGALNAKVRPMRAHEDVLVFSRSPQPPYYPQGLRPSGRQRGAGNMAPASNYGGGGKAYRQEQEGYPSSSLFFAKDRGNVHPTQKPIALLTYLILTYTRPGEVVLDNTMGSGSTGVAAVRSGRGFVGIELDPDHYQSAKQRIAWALDRT